MVYRMEDTMDEKKITPLTTDEILDRAYHVEPKNNLEPTKSINQITADMTDEQKELYMEMICEEMEKKYGDAHYMTDDEAEAYAQGFAPYGGVN